MSAVAWPAIRLRIIIGVHEFDQLVLATRAFERATIVARRVRFDAYEPHLCTTSGAIGLPDDSAKS
jgi:hypothetical protein